MIRQPEHHLLLSLDAFLMIETARLVDKAVHLGNGIPVLVTGFILVVQIGCGDFRRFGAFLRCRTRVPSEDRVAFGSIRASPGLSTASKHDQNED